MFRSIIYLSAVIVAINFQGIEGECMEIRSIPTVCGSVLVDIFSFARQ